MSRPLKIFLSLLFGVASLVILAAVWMHYFVDVNVYKQRLEDAASDALGMEVSVDGRLGLKFFPGLLVTMKDVHIRNRDDDIVSAEDAWLWIDIFPLLFQDLRIGQISLKKPQVSIVRGFDGHFNFERQESAEGTLPALNFIRIALTDARLNYTDRPTGESLEADGCSLDVNRLQLVGGSHHELLRNVTLKASLACGVIRRKDLEVTDAKISVNGQNGIYALEFDSMYIFDGKGTGRLQADYSGIDPVYQVNYSLSKFNIQEFIAVLSPNKVAEGLMDFRTNLSLQGKTADDLLQSANGEVSIRGEHVRLNDIDIDKKLSRFESSQNFNLVDVGAFFFAGPFSLLVTKGYNFLSIFQGSGEHSVLREIVSDWNVDRGVAQAKDVAMATNKNRIALRGGLDFVNQRFNDFSVAVLDVKGCPTLRQEVRGSFQKPEIDKPKVLASLVGPAVSLLKKGKGLLTGEKCKVFYEGTVKQP